MGAGGPGIGGEEKLTEPGTLICLLSNNLHSHGKHFTNPNSQKTQDQRPKTQSDRARQRMVFVLKSENQRGFCATISDIILCSF